MSTDSTPEECEAMSASKLYGLRHALTLCGHTGPVVRIAWSADGQMLATSSRDGTIRIWDAVNREPTHTLSGYTAAFGCIAFSPHADPLIAGVDGGSLIWAWNARTGNKLWSRPTLYGMIVGVAWIEAGSKLAVCGRDGHLAILDGGSGAILNTIYFSGTVYGVNEISWSRSGLLFAYASPYDRKSMALYSLYDQREIWASSLGERVGRPVAIGWSPSERILACGFKDGVVSILDAQSGLLLQQLDRHTDQITAISFSPDERFLVSASTTGEAFIWRCDTWKAISNLQLHRHKNISPPYFAFHPTKPILATVGPDEIGGEPSASLVNLWELDFAALEERAAEVSVHYANAKVVLVGDTGVGKSGLAIVLNEQPYRETDSTAGRHVWAFDSQEVSLPGDVTQTRETLLWDLAGQPGYRVIHQLHLNEVAVALIVFDARNETDPLAGVRHWGRALRLAQQRQGVQAVPMKKFLVSARNDRGSVSVSKERLQELIDEFEFERYFETSSKELRKIAELRTAIVQAIAWEHLPAVSSSQLFADIKTFLLDVKKTGRLLVPVVQIFDEFVRLHPGIARQVMNLRDQFDRCIGRLENRDLIRCLTFGDYLLLQPELLDAYGSAMVNAAKEEPDGLGSLAEEIALAGTFFVPKEHRVPDSGQQQLLLHATVEELVLHDLALRENADDGRYLVFPSQFNRDYEDAPEPKGKSAAITFDGPVQSLYSTLVVRLGHSGLFAIRRAEMWRNAAVFDAKAGGRCGLFLHEFMEARGRLILFYPDKHSSAETRFHFEDFVQAHVRRRALDKADELVRFFICESCGDPVPDSYVKRLRSRGILEFECPCGGIVSLVEPKERIQFQSKVGAMERSADRQRDFDAFVVSAKGETSTQSFLAWTGGLQVTLAIVFTDIVGSTALGEEIRDEAMSEVRHAHFAQSRELIERFQGREIKTIGDSFMAAFKNACAALDYARELQQETGHEQVRIRAGIHIGPMQVEEDDVFGGTVNFAARVVGAIQGAEIWLSDRAREDVDRLGASNHKHLQWTRHDDVPMKGFSGKWTLWALRG